MRVLCAIFALAASLQAGESVLLVSGGVLRAQSHEIEAGRIRLRTRSGTVDFPLSAVESIEPDPAPPAPAPVVNAAPVPKPVPADVVADAALRHGLPVDFVRTVARAESGMNPKAVSRKGAIGLMQLMPETAKLYGANPHDPAENADAGVRYLRDLLDRYRDDPFQVRLALAAYNAGPGAVDKYQGIPPYRETRNYVSRVIRGYYGPSRRKPCASGSSTTNCASPSANADSAPARSPR